MLVKISGIAEQGQRPESVGYERWAMDVTHIPCCRDGSGHLVVVIDCHDCEIVAYEFALRGRDSQLPRTPMNSHPPQGAHAMGTLVVKLGPPTLKGGAARAAARALPRGAQEGNEAASLHPLDLGLEACAT